MVEQYYKSMFGDRPTTRHIDHMSRTKTGGFGKESEWLTWHQTVFGQDEDSNDISWYSTQGSFSLPKFIFQNDLISKKPKAVGIRDYETVYEVPFDVKNIRQVRSR